MNRDELIEKLAEQAFISDDLAGHHKAHPFVYSPYEWTTIPEEGRQNYRRLIREVLDVGLPLIEADVRDRLTPAPDDLVTECLSIAYGIHDDEPVEVGMSAVVQHVRERIATEIDAAFVEWDSLGAGAAPYAPQSPGWLVERAYADAARIARGADR